MAKRKQQDAAWGTDREYPSRGYKAEVRLSAEEQLSQIQVRIENIRSGSDDALLEECELLSRGRDEKLNALVVKDGNTVNKAKGPNSRMVAEQARKSVSDEFDAQRASAQQRLLRECQEEEERLKEEIASNKLAGVEVRAKRKTRARMEADAASTVVINSQGNILNKLGELESKVGLSKEELDSDLDSLRSKDGKPPKPAPAPAKPAGLQGKAAGKAADKPGPGKSPASLRNKPAAAARAKKEDSSPIAAVKEAAGIQYQQPARQKEESRRDKDRDKDRDREAANGRQSAAENKVYSAKGIMYCSGLRIAKGEEVKVTTPDGETIVGKLSSVNSLEMRLVVEGQEPLYKVYLAHLRTGKATVIKTDTPPSAS